MNSYQINFVSIFHSSTFFSWIHELCVILCIHSCLYLEYVLIAVDHHHLSISTRLFKWNTTFSVLDRFRFFHSNNSNSNSTSKIVNGFVSIFVVVMVFVALVHRTITYFSYSIDSVENILKFLICFCFITWKIFYFSVVLLNFLCLHFSCKLRMQ